MNDEPDHAQSFAAGASWLQVVEGRAPILLIAPHGGRAGQAARARLHPRVNDLHTAEITRELSRRLHAHALINAGMDRNALDCNRVEDIAGKAPWVLAMVARRVEELAARHGRVLVLVIHGWNVVEARIDFGLGARFHSGRLRPVASAHITASERFINGPLARLCAGLQTAGILPTLGLRYPAAGRQNLLQIFTPRFGQSRLEPLRNLAALAASGLIDAVQLELSVALRWPGALRDRTIGLLSETFASSAPTASFASPAAVARRHHTTASRVKSRPKAVSAAPFRFGLEFFDPSCGIGAMASMDLNGGDGARVIMLLPDGRVALCTAEGKLELQRNRLTRGPIRLLTDGDTVSVEFDGPALVVPNAAAYLRMEQALETGSIDHSAAFRCTLELRSGIGSIGFDGQFLSQGSRRSGYGVASGAITINGVTRPLNGLGKAGVSLLGQAERPFVSRCSLWAYFPGGRSQAIEARQAIEPDREPGANATVLTGNAAVDCRVEQLRAEAWSPGRAPSCIEAVLAHPTGTLRVTALPRCFMALSRPGPAATRVFTSLGFASFELDGTSGAGMFECSSSVSATDSPKSVN
jgi:hypothetical protein